MSEEERARRKVWRDSETRGFLKCYLAHKNEFTHLRKKRNAYANVLQDMIAEGYTDSTTTVLSLENKMRTLLAAYKSAKNHDGNAEARFYVKPYVKEMEAIYDGAPEEQGNSVFFANIQEDSLLVERLPQSSSPRSPKMPQSSELLEQAREASRENHRRKKSARERYYEEKIKLKRTLAKEKLEEKRRFHNSIVETIKEIELKKLEMLKESLSS